MLKARIHASILAALTLGAVAAATHAQPVYPNVVEFEAESSASVFVDAMPEPLMESAMALDADVRSPQARALAEIRRGTLFTHPSASCEVVTDGWAPGSTTIYLNAAMGFDLGDWRPGFPPLERTATGSWRHRLVFDLDERARIHLSIRPREFDDMSFTDYEPGRLTGPDGLVVGGQPASGSSTWIWLRNLEPGRYTFESFGAFEFVVDGENGASDRASMDISFSFFVPPCRADFDGDGELTIFDFLEFQNLFDAGDLEADFDGDGELTLFDFLAFQNAFDAGCE